MTRRMSRAKVNVYAWDRGDVRLFAEKQMKRLSAEKKAAAVAIELYSQNVYSLVIEAALELRSERDL